MARKVIKPIENKVEDLELDEESADLDNEETPDLGHSMSKAGAARAALAEGYTLPKQASAYIKQKYGIDISPQQFSAEKSRLKLRSGGRVSFGNGDPAYLGLGSFSGQRRMVGQADLLEALEVMKPLIEQLGAERVKRMVDLLG